MIEISGRQVGSGHPCFIIGEVAQAHDGSLGMAHAYVDAIADAGADAVKFQTHIASAESTAEEKFRVQFSSQDETRQDYWKRMEFTEPQWQGLADHARDRDLIFLSSPFSIEAVELLARIGVPAWKIASGEVTNFPMIDRIAETRLPVLVSSGMSAWDELDEVIAHIKNKKLPFAVFQCTSAYPSPPEKIGLNLLAQIHERYHCPAGLSDHSGTIYPGLAAVTLGVDMLEVHVTMSREMFGPDVPASVTTTELRQLVEGVRFIETALANPVDKDGIAKQFQPLRDLFYKSVVATADLPAGTVITEVHLTTKKPGTGIPPGDIHTLIGRSLKRDVRKDQLLAEDDFE